MAYGRIPRPEPGRLGDASREGRGGGPVLQHYAGNERLELLPRRLPFDLSPVGLERFCRRLADPGLEAPIVGQQQQSFAVEVEAPGGIDRSVSDEVPERRSPGIVTELAQDLVGLVQ